MRAFALDCGAFAGEARVLSFRGEEELARCFEFEIVFALDPPDDVGLQASDLLGAAATLTLGEPDRVRLSGFIAEIEVIDEVPDAVYRIRLVPELWFLRHSAHSRVYVDRTVPEIIERVLRQAGIAADAFEMRLGAAYERREHVCQYRESDLDFVQRWMERAGIYYFFDHRAAGSKLVIVDGLAEPLSLRDRPVLHRPVGPSAQVGEHLRVFHETVTARPKEAVSADYNYLEPDRPVRAVATVAPDSKGRVQHWGVNESDFAGASRSAVLQAERELCEQRRFVAVGTAWGIHAGFCFSLAQHAIHALNRTYLAVRVVHRGHISAHAERLGTVRVSDALGSEPYQVEIETIGSDVQYRPAMRTPWPRAAGLELARIDGAAESDHAQIDGMGRYLVRLMMDESEAAPGKASTRVRLLEPHGGAPEGLHFPLRKNTEVLLMFVGGDPDRPLIVGTAPNAVTPSPVSAAHRSHNVLQTGGLTRIEIEDLEGQQYIDVSTPPESTYFHLGAHAGLGDHNVVLGTGGDGLVRTGGDHAVTVDGNQSEEVLGPVTEQYHASVTRQVAGRFQQIVDGGANQSIRGGLRQTITGGVTRAIQGGVTRSTSGGVTELVNGSTATQVVGPSTESDSATRTQTVTTGATLTSAGPHTLGAGGDMTLTASGAVSVLANALTMLAPGGQVNVDDFQTFLAGVWKHRFQFLLNINGVNAAAGGLNVEAFGARFDFVAMKREYAGALFQTGSFSIFGGVVSGCSAGVSFGVGFLMLL